MSPGLGVHSGPPKWQEPQGWAHVLCMGRHQEPCSQQLSQPLSPSRATPETPSRHLLHAQDHLIPLPVPAASGNVGMRKRPHRRWQVRRDTVSISQERCSRRKRPLTCSAPGPPCCMEPRWESGPQPAFSWQDGAVLTRALGTQHCLGSLVVARRMPGTVRTVQAWGSC